jgi:hypothetical protein
MGNKGAGGPFAPLVVVVRNVVGEKEFNKLRGKAISLHSQGAPRAVPRGWSTSWWRRARASGQTAGHAAAWCMLPAFDVCPCVCVCLSCQLACAGAAPCALSDLAAGAGLRSPRSLPRALPAPPLCDR